MQFTVAPLDAIRTVSPPTAPELALKPPVPSAPHAPDPAAVLAFREGIHATRPGVDATRPGARPQHVVLAAAPHPQASNGLAETPFFRWADETQRNFSDAMDHRLDVRTTSISMLMEDMKHFHAACISVTLLKSVADQFIQAGQTLLRQQN